MRAPTNYAGPRASDNDRGHTMSQSAASNTATDFGTVEKLLAKKGGSIISVLPHDSIKDTVDILREKRIGAVLVLSASGQLQGILSERDIVRKLSTEPEFDINQPVEELMTRKVKSCAPNEPLFSVLRTMTEGRFRHMPVMDGGKLLGMVTIGDVVHYRLDELEHETVQLKQMIVG